MSQDDLRFRLLRLLEADPTLSQREIAAELGLSLGRVNYVLRALVEKGQVKAGNFRVSQNKLAYAYLLTPGGIEEKARLASGFLKRKLAEYEALQAEIRTLQREMDEAAQDGPAGDR
ncbi:EPS-associated MarR family transcriptional regulator [Limimaricola soesokkakensis]|uniref:EPS-associated MarR family transcriptional regulator n=1 Tax=Limimaricola soesokkakensis TaxID=1343159 RepID=A0A1X7A0X8_9RHOB|nr:MarR family EPS-associated transcriptional regulator [Limimaricola soesokkakensis]PSK80410.1 EPS-associated MarR family transcriptional regulator [Limimaricola soesokkakensis]SLN66891.1 MarR family protein [Limimaricola soesokkakensis]